MPAGQKSLTTPSLGHSSNEITTTQYKACADCGLRIPQEQAVIFHDLPSIESRVVVVCTDCRWVRGIDPPRPPHASDYPAELSPIREIPLSSPSSDETSIYSSGNSSVDVRVSGPSRLPQLLSPRETPHPTLPQPTIPLSTPNTPTPTPNTNPHLSKKNTDDRTEPSPCTDITRLRVKRSGKYCLYPGSTFRGVQKSGRSDYDVTVTILDIDFATSFLCGYLEIRGLTEDWPELTTYFDAEIIGAEYSFLTRGWGATHEDDLHHWSSFPAYSSSDIQNDLQLPRYTLREELGHRDRGCVFMRWKERFLVPDHRVKDINGASFAGFYYICVEYEPSQRLDAVPGTALPNEDYEPLPASMSGFYFHKNSEPYQQLSLHHVPDEELGMGNGSFEWR